MQKLSLLALVFCGLGACLLSACSRQPTTPAEPGATAASSGAQPAESTAAGSSTASSSTASSSTGNSASEPASQNSASAQADVKVEFADHAQLIDRIQQSKGRVVVVDVWSTSCLPCMKEFPHLIELARRWPEDVVCISMNVDFLGLPSAPVSTVVPKVTEFLKSQGAAADNLIHLISSEPDTDVLTKLGIESLPAILVSNRAGEPAAKLTIDSAGPDGLSYASDVVPLVEKLVEEQN